MGTDRLRAMDDVPVETGTGLTIRCYLGTRREECQPPKLVPWFRFRQDYLHYASGLARGMPGKSVAGSRARASCACFPVSGAGAVSSATARTVVPARGLEGRMATGAVPDPGRWPDECAGVAATMKAFVRPTQVRSKYPVKRGARVDDRPRFPLPQRRGPARVGPTCRRGSPCMTSRLWHNTLIGALLQRGERNASCRWFS
jgi:hypothetical protein